MQEQEQTDTILQAARVLLAAWQGLELTAWLLTCEGVTGSSLHDGATREQHCSDQK